MSRTFSYPPPIMDKATLAWHLSISADTVDNRVRDGLLPPGTMWGGKLVWKWSVVESHMEHMLGAQPNEADLAAKVYHATKRAVDAR